MTGQCATYRLRSGSQSRVCGSKLSLRLAWVVGGARLQLFQPQLQLFDLPIQFLRLSPKLHAPQLGNQQLQMLDLALVGEQLLMLRKDQRLQSSLIQQIQVGKDGLGSSHIRSMPSTLLCEYSAAHKKLCKSHRGNLDRQLRLRRAHWTALIDAFQQHRQLRSRQRNRAVCCLWPDESSALQAFGEQAESVPIPPQHFDQITAPAAKHKHVTREWALLQPRLHQRTQPLEATPHVGYSGRDPDMRFRW